MPEKAASVYVSSAKNWDGSKEAYRVAGTRRGGKGMGAFNLLTEE